MPSSRDAESPAGPSMKAFQDYYPDESAHCYGCGRLNEHGLHIHSFWDGEESVARFTPREYHIALPGFVNGGVLASLIDCHGTGTAAAAADRAEGRGGYLKPTPLGVELEVRGRVKEIKGRKVVIEETISAGGNVTVRGEVVAVEVPGALIPKG